MKFDEEKLIETVKPYFASARAGDWKHALRVVKWVKELAEGKDNLNTLITAAYVHDIGWSGIAPKGKIDFDEMVNLEPMANKNSSRMISEALTKLHFTDSEIEEVNKLVIAADKRRSENDDEAIIVDADNLSKLCIEHLQEKYQQDSFLRLINIWKIELPERVKTHKGKQLFPKLIVELESKVMQINE